MTACYYTITASRDVLHCNKLVKLNRTTLLFKLGVSPANLFKSTKVLMATPQGRRLGYHTPEQVSNQEPV